MSDRQPEIPLKEYRLTVTTTFSAPDDPGARSQAIKMLQELFQTTSDQGYQCKLQEVSKTKVPRRVYLLASPVKGGKPWPG